MDSSAKPPLPDEWRDLLIDDFFENLTSHITSNRTVNDWLSSKNTIIKNDKNAEKIVGFLAFDNTTQPYTTNQLAKLIAKSLLFDATYWKKGSDIVMSLYIMESICTHNYIETEYEFKIFKKEVMKHLAFNSWKIKVFWDQLQDLWYDEHPGSFP